MSKQKEALVEACRACVVHARHLVESAKLVHQSGRANIAYHLATLALEEMGRRELFQIYEVASRRSDAPEWQSKATQDHTRKLFWCLYSFGRVADIADQRQFFEKREAAADIHTNRLAGLYVENSEIGLAIPAEAISKEQAEALIKLAENIVAVGESEEPREVSQEEIELQDWLLSAFDTPELRNQILTKESIESLREINDVAAWARKMRSDIEASDAQLKELVQKELRRATTSLENADEDRWSIQLRLRTTSNSIRPKPLKRWNEKVRWIKLHPQQGALSKEELIVEMILGDNIPLGALQSVATSLSIQLVIALNLATSGFWWWPLPPNQQRTYERIRDLEKGLNVKADDQSFKVFDAKAALTDIHMENLMQCWAALPDPRDGQAQALQHYLGGLTFIALNCVQLRSEAQAFANFVQSFALFVKDANYLKDQESTESALERFVKEKFPDLDAAELEQLLDRVRTFNQKKQVGPGVDLGNVYFMKLLCETMFRDFIMRPAVRRKSQTQ